MKLSRRSMLFSGGAVLVPVAGLGPAVAAADGFGRSRPGQGNDVPFHGYGELVADPKHLLDLPRGFQVPRVLGARASR